MSYARKLLVTLSLAASILYFANLLPDNVVWKGLSVSPLALLALLERERLLGLALALGSLGDVLLGLSPSLFVAGLFAFLIGHVVYTVLWVRNWPRPLRPQWTSLGMLWICASAVCLWLLPFLGAMAVPVFFYMLAITTMVTAAIVTRITWVMLGAVLFFVSDSLLGINRFWKPLPYREVLVWATYYLGQLAIALGYLMHKPQESRAAHRP